MKLRSRFYTITFSVVLFVCVFFCSFNFVNAEENNSTDVLNRIFVYPFAEPQVDGHHGYINVLLNNKSNGNYTVRTYVVSFIDYSGEPEMFVKLYTGTDTFTITCGNAPQGFYVWTMKCNDATYSQDTTLYSASNPFTFDFSNTFDIISYQAYFPIDRLQLTPANQNFNNFTVLWAPDSALYQSLSEVSLQINDLISKISSLYSLTNSQLTNLNSKLQTLITNMSTDLSNIISKLVSAYSMQNSHLANLNTKLLTLNTTMSELMDIITDVNLSDEEKIDEIEDIATNQSETLDSALEELNDIEESIGLPSPEDAMDSVEENIDEDKIDEFSDTFVQITSHELISEMILIVITVAFVSYILFGRKN